MNMRSIHKKYKVDKWSVSEQDAISWWGSLVHIHYKNREACSIEKIGDDMKHWTLDNPKLAIDQENIVERLFFESGKLMNTALDLYDMWATHNPCENDAEKIERHGRWWNDVCNMSSRWHGVHVSWDDTPTHIKESDFRKKYHALKKELPKRNIAG